jgi:hypothetical protein
MVGGQEMRRYIPHVEKAPVSEADSKLEIQALENLASDLDQQASEVKQPDYVRSEA